MTKSANTSDLINKVVSFYQQYLDCSPEQLDLLALWTMHTHIIPAAPFSPSLNICSREKHSGKTVCLQLLSLLCDGSHMHTAAAPSLLLHQLTDDEEPFSGTLLLDDCDATFGKTRMNIKLQGLFTARFQQDARFTVRVKDDGEYVFDDRLVFFPAAFAGKARLHPSLAERSILIALESKKPGSPCQPFRFYAAQNQGRSLYYDLTEWGNANHERLEKIAPYKEDQFPPELSWRHRDCAEPLLHVADFIGGNWPQRARQALVNAFALATFEDFYSSKLVLSDIRDAFFEKGNPEWISSNDVLEFLHTMDNRAWDTWTKDKPMQPKALARLLEPFGIQPRNHRTGPKSVPKGYYREDLEPVWTKHLPALTCGAAALACGEKPAPRRGPNGITDAPSPVAANPQVSVLNYSEPDAVLRYQPKEAGSQKLGAAVPVAANSQNLPSSTPKPAVTSQKSGVAVPVAAKLQNSIPQNPKPGVSSQKLAAPPVAARLQNSLPATPAPGSVLRSQPKQANSQKLGAGSALISGKPTVGQRIMASSQPPPGGRKQNGLLLDSNLR